MVKQVYPAVQNDFGSVDNTGKCSAIGDDDLPARLESFKADLTRLSVFAHDPCLWFGVVLLVFVIAAIFAPLEER
ncbi:MAG TPA: hypothetical protein VKT25_00110 [Ktedonobacteraceae bacterium]|nr:hypothetical protein [Ktedonobacteraceae bacterium]